MEAMTFAENSKRSGFIQVKLSNQAGRELWAQGSRLQSK